MDALRTGTLGQRKRRIPNHSQVIWWIGYGDGRRLIVSGLGRANTAARLECATAANFNMCLNIKMGSEADYIGACSGFKEGAPAVAPSPEAPNLLECFFLTGKL